MGERYNLGSVNSDALLTECLDKCTEVSACAGVVFPGLATSSNGPKLAFDATATINCVLIKGTIKPGDSKRTLTKAVYSKLSVS